MNGRGSRGGGRIRGSWREEHPYYMIDCPGCGALAGTQCVDAAGRFMPYAPHLARKKAYGKRSAFRNPVTPRDILMMRYIDVIALGMCADALTQSVGHT